MKDPLTEQLTTATMWLIFACVTIASLAVLAKVAQFVLGIGCG